MFSNETKVCKRRTHIMEAVLLTFLMCFSKIHHLKSGLFWTLLQLNMVRLVHGTQVIFAHFISLSSWKLWSNLFQLLVLTNPTNFQQVLKSTVYSSCIHKGNEICLLTLNTLRQTQQLKFCPSVSSTSTSFVFKT